MTIFVEIAKHFLHKAIQEAYHDSIDADKSLLNSALKLLAFPRDEELGQAKRKILSELEKELKIFKPQGSDEYSLHEFHKLLREYKKRIGTAAGSHQLDEGKTGLALSKAAELVQSIFNELEKLQLLDTPKSKELLSVFQYYIGKYFADKVFSDQRLSTVEGFAVHPSFSSFRQRAQDRAELIVQALAQCTKDLDLLNKDHPEYKDGIKQAVTRNIETLLRNEQALNKEHLNSANFALLVLNTAGLAKDDNNLLSHLMQEALREIQLIIQGKDTHNISDWLNPDEEAQYHQEKQQRLATERELAKAALETRETIARGTVISKQALLFDRFMADVAKKTGALRQQPTAESDDDDFVDAEDIMQGDPTSTNFNKSL